MQLVVNTPESHAPLRLRPERRMTEDEYFEFCRANPEVRMERTAQGEIVIMAPAGGETAYRNSDLTAELRN
jgi:Uma2 family endonuclease